MHLCWDIKLRIQDRQPPLLFWADANFKESLHEHLIHFWNNKVISWWIWWSDQTPFPQRGIQEMIFYKKPFSLEDRQWPLRAELMILSERRILQKYLSCYLLRGYYLVEKNYRQWTNSYFFSFHFLSIWIGKGWKKSFKKVVKNGRGMDNVEIDSKIIFGSEDTQKHFRRLKHFVWYFWILESHIW